MKTMAACVVCFEDQAVSGTQRPFSPLTGELDDCGYVHVRCEKGHQSVMIYDARRHEVLVRSAAKAFVDGYTNEVVAVMSTALERAYEFYIRVSCRAKGIPKEAVEKAWKGVASQSERQFGAFQFLYLIDHAQAFALDNFITETRNNVIHKGRIVREETAASFAEKVFARIRSIEDSIQSKFLEHSAAEAAQEVEEQRRRVPDGMLSATMKLHTVRVDPSRNEVIGVADCFMGVVGAVQQSRSRGLPV
jgi:hypothetical protein